MSETAPVLVTKRLELWRPSAADLEDMVDLLEEPETRRYLAMDEVTHADVHQRLCRNAGSWSLYGYGLFAVRLLGGPQIVASCGIFHSWRGFDDAMNDVPEAGWIVRLDREGHGIAREAMEAALGWFDDEHGRSRITCMIDEGNEASHLLAQRLGFTPFGKHCEDGDGADLVLYERLSTKGPVSP
ncbi:N-acetyltransferase [Novosphingobium marinum]|uniref:RimJ/RimL family protein N-acetyltransferase n=1 Tax=Novosphingobium marinum TaxID=1514948 RepID=A0A7Y9XYH8_9SPHN|nr:GNAT family protein [Novosphingobium marinum]NYH95715.1 RimJ/RimL family protein N-acetyltransferase [Novosphingobium marinum]GGC29289.1 N-acetyltransferase [Novosphingobium marinum]